MTTSSTTFPIRDRAIGEIAATLPGAIAVFRKFKLNFCCGGDKALEGAARERGLEVDAIEHELASLLASPGDADHPDHASLETPALIRHILSRFHETHRQELPALIQLARKVEAVHDGHPQVPHGLADHLRQMAGELEVHMKKEELILFPAMNRGTGPLAQPIARMRDEHDEHGAALSRLDEIVQGFALPDDACGSWRALYAGTAKLRDDLMEHILLENSVLFPRFAAPEAE